jgi:hypothetical protein
VAATAQATVALTSADQTQMSAMLTDPATTSTIAADFNATPIDNGSTVWFSSVAKVGPAGSATVVRVINQQIEFTAGGTAYSLEVPDAVLTFDPTATQASTTYNYADNVWETTVPASFAGNVFMSGLALPVPVGLPGGIKHVQWSGEFEADAPGKTVEWKWAAAAYSSFSTDYGALGVKPLDGDKLNPYHNSDHAGTPEAYKPYVDAGARGGGGSNWTGSYSGAVKLTPRVVSW